MFFLENFNTKLIQSAKLQRNFQSSKLKRLPRPAGFWFFSWLFCVSIINFCRIGGTYLNYLKTIKFLFAQFIEIEKQTNISIATYFTLKHTNMKHTNLTLPVSSCFRITMTYRYDETLNITNMENMHKVSVIHYWIFV